MKKGIDSNGSNPLKWDKEQGGKTRNGGGGWGGSLMFINVLSFQRYVADECRWPVKI